MPLRGWLPAAWHTRERVTKRLRATPDLPAKVCTERGPGGSDALGGLGRGEGLEARLQRGQSESRPHRLSVPTRDHGPCCDLDDPSPVPAPWSRSTWPGRGRPASRNLRQLRLKVGGARGTATRDARAQPLLCANVHLPSPTTGWRTAAAPSLGTGLSAGGPGGQEARPS